jgi:hypothetical protein
MQPITTRRAAVTPEQLQALVAQLTARANNEHGAAEVPGSPSARRFETMRQISAQMEPEGYFAGASTAACLST